MLTFSAPTHGMRADVEDFILPEALERDHCQAVQEYRDRGFASLGPILSARGLQALRERTEDLMLGRVTYPGLFFQLDSASGNYRDAPLGLGWQGPSLAYRKLEKLELDDRFKAWLSHPLFQKIVQTIIPGPVVLYRAIVFNKGAQGSSDIPWHQDGGKFWGLTAEPELQIWTALDDATPESGCLEFVPRSHRTGLVTPLGGVIPEERAAVAKPVALPVQAGDVVLIHNHVWHRSGRTPVGVRRMAFSACYMSQQIRCVRRKRAPRTFPLIFP